MFRSIKHRIIAANLVLTHPTTHHIMAGVLFLIVFLIGVNTTRTLEWGPNADFYRDVGFAQTILDGDFGDDPVYSDERLWYNPLVPTLIAGISWGMDTPPHIAATRAGAYLNILIPLSFYILLLVMSQDSRIALAGVVCFLFIAPGEYEATYSPWLLPTTFTQSLFYLTIAAYIHAGRSRKLLWFALTGILLGGCFLGHTAPALIAGIIILSNTLRLMLREWDDSMNSPELYRRFTEFVVIIGAALLVSFPFWIYILGHYGLEIVNEAPARWRAPLLYLENLRLLLSTKVSIWLIFSVVGFVSVLKSRRFPELWIILTWLFVTIFFVLYGYVEQVYERLGGGILPSIVPSYHMLMYLDAITAVLAGYGVVIVARFLLRWFGALVSQPMRFEKFEVAAVIVLSALIVVLNFEKFSGRHDFTGAQQQAELVGDVMLDRNGAYGWILTNTDPSDVFVSNDSQLSMLAVMQAGRDLVAAPEFYSNPYVDWVERQEDSEMILELVRSGNQKELAGVSRRNSVSYVMFVDERYNHGFLETVYDNGSVVIYRLRFE